MPKIKTTLYVSESMDKFLRYMKYRTGESKSSLVDEGLFLLAQKIDSRIFKELSIDSTTSFIDLDRIIEELKQQ